MLNEEICKLRDKLNKSIECGESYDITYNIIFFSLNTFFKTWFK